METISLNSGPTEAFLVTGGAGFIGSHLVRHLMEKTEHDVLVVDKLTYAGSRQIIKDYADNSRFQFLQEDISNQESVRSIVESFQPDCILHLAAESHVDRSIDGPEAFVETNVMGTFRLLMVALQYWEKLCGAKKEGFRFLHVSTDEVYGSLGWESPAFTETSAYKPRSPYSASKAASDHFARAWHETYGLPVIVTNCSNNFGPWQFPEKLIPLTISKCLRGEPIPVYGKGDNIRDWIYVADHVEALRQVASYGQPGETYLIGARNERSNLEVVEAICDLIDHLHSRETPAACRELIQFVADRPGHDRRYAINAEKLSQNLDWRPSGTFEEQLEQTVRWYLNHLDWWQSTLDSSYQLQRMGKGVLS